MATKSGPPRTGAGSRNARTSRYRAPALEKGLDVIELLAAEKSPLNLSAISQRLGRSSGELFRMLQVLEFKGFITTAENGSGYVLTNKLFALAMAQAPVRSLVETALPIMRKLVARHRAVLPHRRGVRRPDRRDHAHRTARRSRLLGAHRLPARNRERHLGPGAVRLPERRRAPRLAQALPPQGRSRRLLHRARQRRARRAATTKRRRTSCAASSICPRPSCAATPRSRRSPFRSCTAIRCQVEMPQAVEFVRAAAQPDLERNRARGPAMTQRRLREAAAFITPGLSGRHGAHRRRCSSCGASRTASTTC